MYRYQDLNPDMKLHSKWCLSLVWCILARPVVWWADGDWLQSQEGTPAMGRRGVVLTREGGGRVRAWWK
jgi:hypothetical protein